jgi:hypothetical protein
VKKSAIGRLTKSLGRKTARMLGSIHGESLDRKKKEKKRRRKKTKKGSRSYIYFCGDVIFLLLIISVESEGMDTLHLRATARWHALAPLYSSGREGPEMG